MVATTFDLRGGGTHLCLSVVPSVGYTGCGRKKWTPKVLRCFLSNRLEF